MSYNTSKLLTAAECDQAISNANDRKTDLQFEQIVRGRELNGREKTSSSVQASLASVTAEITGTQAAIDSLPEGTTKTEMQSKLRRLNDRKDNLTERLNKGGAVGVLDTELDAGLLKVQLTEIDQYVTAVTTRKTEL